MADGSRDEMPFWEWQEAQGKGCFSREGKTRRAKIHRETWYVEMFEARDENNLYVMSIDETQAKFDCSLILLQQLLMYWEGVGMLTRKKVRGKPFYNITFLTDYEKTPVEPAMEPERQILWA